MRRRVLLAAVVAAFAAAAAGCGESGEKAVAHIGDTKVTREQLEQTMEHFSEESSREGRPFAEDAAARKHLVGLLVYRARLELGAKALGITVSDEAVERRLESAGGDEGGEADARAYFESSVRVQLLKEAVYRKLAARIHDGDPQRAQARRNAALDRWLASLAKSYPTR
jgi:SurA-like N-terminal domain